MSVTAYFPEFSLKMGSNEHLVLEWKEPSHTSNELVQSELIVVCESDTKLAGANATLWCNDGDSQYPVASGIIQQQTDVLVSAEGVGYHLVMISSLHRLNTIEHSRVFVDVSLTELFTQILNLAGFAADEYVINLLSYPNTFSQHIQYEETDLAFIQRLCRHYGLLFLTDALGKLFIVDDASAFPTTHFQDLPYIKRKRDVAENYCTSELYPFATLLPKTIHLECHNLRDPKARLKIAGSNETPAITHYFAHFDTHELGKTLQARYQSALDAHRVGFTLWCNHPALGLQQTLSVNDVGYRVIGIERHYRSLVDTPIDMSILPEVERQGYAATLTVILSTEPYFLMPELKMTRSYGSMMAVIDSASEVAAPYLNELGEYRVKFDFDELTHKPGHASAPLPLATISSNAFGGMHFPLYPGTKVLVQCVNNNLFHTIIKRVIPNEEQPSLTTCDNPTEHHWRTAANQGLVMNDANDNSYVCLYSKNHAQELIMKAGEQPALHLNANQGGISETIATTYTETVGGNYTQTVGGNSSIVAKSYRADIGGDLSVHAQQNIELRAEEKLTLRANHFHAKAGEWFGLQSGGDMSFIAGEAINFHTKSFNATAKNITLIADEGISISQGGALIQLNPNGDVLIQGNSITLNTHNITTSASPQIQNVAGQAAPLPTLPKAPRIHSRLPEEYWVKMVDNQNQIYPTSQTIILNDDDDEYSSISQSDGFAMVQTKTKDLPNNITCDNTLILGVNAKMRNDYPSHRLTLNHENWLDATKDNINPHTPSKGDPKLLTLTILQPMMMVNLRSKKPQLLSEEELNYFKQRGNNVLVFIHGYNIKEGTFPHELLNVKFGTKMVDISPISSHHKVQTRKVPTATGEFNQLTRDICMSQEELCKQYPKLASFESKFMDIDSALQYGDENNKEAGLLNGSEDKNWFLHLEDNLNRATGQFDGADYSHYQRLLHVAWRGDVGLMPTVDFPWAEDEADNAGMNFVATLEQLINAGLTINIIAHSLGNRVALRALDELGKKGKSIEHLFSWEAAVPDNSLSLAKDAPFPHASNATKKITVLCNQYDEVLGAWYHADKEAPSAAAEVIDTMRFDVPSFVRDEKRRENVPKALGLRGPDDETFKSLKGKIIRADLSPFAKGHSYMCRPSKTVMQHGYETWIVNSSLRGVNGFGLYDAARFPKYPAYRVSINGEVTYDIPDESQNGS